MGSSLSEERTTLFTGEKNDTSNRKPQRCVSFAPKFPLFIGACSLQRPHLTSCFADIQRECQRVFPVDQWKTSRKLEWNSFLCFADDEENCRDPAKPRRKGKNRTRRKLRLCYLNLYSNQPFSIVYSEQKVNITALVTLKLPHYIFNKRSYFGAVAGGGGGGGGWV